MSSAVRIVILSRDLDALLRLCLQHISRSAVCAGWASPTIVVVDNASRWPCPESMPDAPSYRLVRQDRHHSFASSCNRGAADGDEPFLLFLNNDVLLDERALADIRGAFERNPLTTICGTRMVFPNAAIQHAGVVFGAGDVGPYHVDRLTPSHLVPRARERFQAVTGAAMAVRRSAFVQLGGFDEAYPFGLEDIDLCLRAGQAGQEIRCVQGSDSLHLESMTPGRSDLDVPSRALFMERWRGRYAIDG